MKKAFDQTVRDLKREVNKKVLKVPNIEQKILDATSNEPWGPHGSLLADIAQATRNYHEYQMIMNVIWKRINDTGKNWRHVYKALTVLEYLVAHGSERVIDEMKEHAYQISTLSDFQYIDSSGRDQGNNVRRKSQSLVALVNDKERIQEARQKAAVNRDKYRSTFSTGRPGSQGGYGDRYDDDRYASRDEDRYGNGKEREWGYRDDDKYGRGRDSYGGEGDRYGRYAEERSGRDGYRDDDYRRGRGNDDYQYGSRNRSLSRDRSLDDDDRSSRSGGGRADNLPHDERQLDRRLSEQSIGAPPSYEEVAKDAQNHVKEDRNESDFTAAAPKASSPSAPRASSSSEGRNQTSSPFVRAASSPFTNQGSGHALAGVSASTNNNDNGFDEFDPRGMASGNADCGFSAPPAAGSHEMNLFGSASASASDPIYSLALVPLTTTNSGTEADLPANSSFATDFVAASSASAVFSQAGENPFGDPPFIATQENFPNQQEIFPPVSSFNSISSGGAEILAPAAPKIETTTSFDFDGSFGGVTYNPVSDGQQSSFAGPAMLTSEAPVTQPNNISGMLAPQTGFTASVIPQESRVATTDVLGNPLLQSGPPAIFASQVTQFTAQEARPIAPTNPQTTQPNLLSQSGLQAPPMEVTACTSSLTPVKAVSSKDKFETKSTVWADTLSRGLVNLNISGSKINPHADIGIDFDSINRKEKRKEEKKVSATPISTTTMGKAMGSGSGIGRAGANTLIRPPNPTMGMGMMGGVGMGMGMMGGGGMGMGMVGNGGMGMGGYGGSINQPMGMGMPPRPPMGTPMGGTGMPGVGYNPMMGMGNYGSQQPYGGGYR